MPGFEISACLQAWKWCWWLSAPTLTIGYGRQNDRTFFADLLRMSSWSDCQSVSDRYAIEIIITARFLHISCTRHNQLKGASEQIFVYFCIAVINMVYGTGQYSDLR
jgi:hypothetical protein